MWLISRRHTPQRSQDDLTRLRTATRCVLLAEEPSASVDYFLHPWLARQGIDVEVHRAPGPPALTPGDFVIVSRYLTTPWLRALKAARPRLIGLAYFMDDDLLDARAWTGLPSDYQKRLHERIGRHTGWLRRQADAFWVSTDALARKYAELSPRLLPLAPLPACLDAVRSLRIAYHGTSSHIAEIAWLRPIIAQVLERCAEARFEIFGDAAVYKLYRELPRVVVLHPMKWPQYLAHTSTTACDLGLAPLLPSAFNEARGAVKFFDFARMGAAALYADVAPYRGFVRHGVDGMLVEMSPTLWSDSILALLSEPTQLRSLGEAARARALDIARTA